MFDWKKTLHIIRGLPGEGKSTLALSLVGGDRARVVENDDYCFVPKSAYVNDPVLGPHVHHRSSHDCDFEYQFLTEYAHLSVQWCLAETFRRLRFFDQVATANVFARRDHIFMFLNEARKLKIVVKLHRPTTSWVGDVEQCSTKNIHGADAKIVQKFRDQWEDLTQDEVDILVNVPSELRASQNGR